MRCSVHTKREEKGSALKAVNHRGQLGYLQSELVDLLWPLYVDISVLVIFFCESTIQPLSVF